MRFLHCQKPNYDLILACFLFCNFIALRPTPAEIKMEFSENMCPNDSHILLIGGRSISSSLYQYSVYQSVIGMCYEPIRMSGNS